MKKLFTLAVIAIASVFGAVNANAEKFYVGGSLGFMHEQKGNDAATNSFTIVPEIGYNLNNHWSFGTTLGYTYKHTCGRDIDYNMFQISPYARFTYFRTSNNLVQLFIDGGAGIGVGATSIHDDTSTAVIYNVGFRPGVAFNITPKFSVVAHLGLLGYEGANHAAKNGGAVTRGGFIIDSNSLDLGFYYNF